MQNMLTEIGTEFGGKIQWRAFSLWYADSFGNLREHGGLIFIINDIVRFRDFEYIPKVLGFEIRSRKAEPYVQFNSSFALSDIQRIDIVCKNAAFRAVRNNSTAKPANLFSRLFRDTVLQIVTSGGNYYFRFPEKEFRKLAGK